MSLIMSLRTQLRKVLPSISITEQEALDAGDVWLEGSIYQGKPDFVALRDVTAATLTSEEQAFLDGPVKTLMGMIDDSEIQNGKHLPDYILDFFKERAFLFSYYPEIIWRSRV
jgi:acyl-CoA dehydrogenase